jgi:hypothetical protein
LKARKNLSRAFLHETSYSLEPWLLWESGTQHCAPLVILKNILGIVNH